MKFQGTRGTHQYLCPNIVDSRAHGLNEKNNLKNTTETLTENKLNVRWMYG